MPHLAPPVFNGVMSIVRTVMSPTTSEIFKNFKDKKDWGPIVNKFVDPSQLPPEYGGVKGSTRKKILAGTFLGNKDGSWSWPTRFG